MAVGPFFSSIHKMHSEEQDIHSLIVYSRSAPLPFYLRQNRTHTIITINPSVLPS